MDWLKNILPDYFLYIFIAISAHLVSQMCKITAKWRLISHLKELPIIYLANHKPTEIFESMFVQFIPTNMCHKNGC